LTFGITTEFETGFNNGCSEFDCNKAKGNERGTVTVGETVQEKHPAPLLMTIKTPPSGRGTALQIASPMIK
jgi:hypothetical protein